MIRLRTYGVGAVLSHVFPNGVERSIAYASRTSTLAEKGCAQLEKEALSLINGVNKYRSVPQIRPPFATLASVQNAGGAYTRDATISLAITPPLPVPIKHDLIVGGR